MTAAQHVDNDPKAITGKTVLVWLICFFGVIFLANGIFIYFALGSFPGVAVDSSYEAGQAYNQEIAAARHQSELNWQVSTTLEQSGRLVVNAADKTGAPLYELAVTAVLRRPAHEAGDVEATLTSDGGGRYVVDLGPLKSGNWDLVVQLEQDGIRKFKSESRIFLSK